MRTIPALLDTDILSAIMRRNPVVLPQAREYLREHDCFTFSILTRYEILRGLKAKDANRQERAFESFCDANTVLPLSDDIIVQAATIYADLHRRGELIGDADILIGATARQGALNRKLAFCFLIAHFRSFLRSCVRAFQRSINSDRVGNWGGNSEGLWR